MLRNYLFSALRNLRKNRLFALINIAGLAIGLLVFALSQLIVKYESSHDAFFEKADRIYVASGTFNPSANIGIRFTTGVQTPIGGLMRENMPAAEIVARTYVREYLAQAGDKIFYQQFKFVEDGFFDIFEFEFLDGSPQTALGKPDGLILTESAARKYFGDADPMGRTITVDSDHDLRVTGIIRDLPKNSHFTSSLLFKPEFAAIADARAFESIADYDVDGNWGNQSSSFITYTLLREGVTKAEADAQLNAILDEFAPDYTKEVLLDLFLTPLVDMNLFPWQTSGIPLMLGLQVLGALVLVIAALNYTNLATAQAISRTREVALRKTMGASRRQLFVQFIAESTLTALIAFVVAIGLMELILPVINDATGKAMNIGVLAAPATLGVILLTVLLTGALSGAYPAYLIARGRTVEMLHDNVGKKRGKNWVRATLLVVQFAISIFMIVAVAIIQSQNLKLQESGNIFPNDQVIVLKRMAQGDLKDSWAPLKNELERIEGVSAVSFISFHPFENSNSSTNVSVQPGDEAGKFAISYISADESFLSALDIPLLAGRNLSKDITEDRYQYDDAGNSISERVNVLINQQALSRLGLSSPEEALGKSFYSLHADPFRRQYTVVGVVPSQNYRGLHNSIRPLMFAWIDSWKFNALVRIDAGSPASVVQEIDRVWAKVLPDYPIDRSFLSEEFDAAYEIFRGVTLLLAAFGAVALMLALFGLFGLAAIMVAGRTKEIGIRKVMGAGTPDIVKLLIWQFSIPVIIGFGLAVLPGYYGAEFYLNFFAERVGLSAVPFLLAGLAVMVLAWVTVAGHAYRVARANPVHALRYE